VLSKAVRDLLSYELNVNDEAVQVSAASHATLLEVLRENLFLTGTKRGCNQGVCGACTIWLDHRPVRSCLTLAANVGQRAVTTIEGIAIGGTLSSLQRCFVEHGAAQCGFCTSGMIMNLEWFLRENPAPTRDEVREALSGQFCRCTGYMKIIDATLAAAHRNRIPIAE
jgi:aerobic-type carbon monoxide dehydrogenase small subunit (CoxS/CutS family)